MSRLMGYELRVEREKPLGHAELASALSAVAEFDLSGTHQNGEVVARFGDAAYPIATWSGRLQGEPASDWQLAQLAVLCDLVGARLVGEDGEVYGIRDGILEQTMDGVTSFEFGKLEEILAAGPSSWSE
ncbi:hypothetical protein [Acrocarpospora catenulata]|uniref:hypothetical protein n=1 Tax=Acrocarpospora catenulata TaxID=2836182 RepID=UPI002023BADA|nr:hypothetical protein [Acrocarpospora catenulata]